MRQISVPVFRFVVIIGSNVQAAFTECTVPTIEWEIEEVKEGGQNMFIHQLPGRRKSARITLKNGVGSWALFDWYLKAMDEEFKRKSISVSLLDSLQQPIMNWHLTGAFPVKWVGPQLKASDNTIAIQTLELVCHEVTVYMLKPSVSN